MDSETTHRESLGEANPLLRWREYLHVLYERRWIPLTIFVAAVAGSMLWNERQEPMYLARARLQVEFSGQRVLNIQDVVAVNEPGYLYQQYMNTQVKALNSRMFAAKVAERVLGGPDSPLRRRLQKSGDAAGMVKGRLSVMPVADSRLVDMVVQDTEAAVAAELANAVADQAVQLDLDRRMEATVDAVEWLRKQAEEYGARLAASETALHDFRESTRMVSLEQRQDIVVSKLKAVNTSLTEAETARIAAEARQNEITTMQARGVPLVEVPSIRADLRVSAAAQAVQEARNALDTLSKRYLSEHPRIQEAEATLADAVEAQAAACEDAARRLAVAFELAVAKEQGLREALRSQEAQALALDRKMMEYRELKRRADVDQELYQGILRRMKEADLAGKLETTSMRLIDRAEVPGRPFKPEKRANLIRAAMGGLGVGLVLAFLVHFMDDRIRRAEDFEHGLGVPVLGLVPRVRLESKRERARVVVGEPDSQAAEAFRGLRAAIQLNPVGREARNLMVVSASAAEGKSFVAVNLASVFAGNDQRTLLVDADMRRPSIHGLLGIDAQVGVPAILEGRVAWRDAVISTDDPLLDVLTGVGEHDMPAELLAGNVLRPLLKELGEAYDRVILDCPPLLGVSDPLMLLPHVDGVLFVSMFNRSHRRAVDDALHEIDVGDTPLLGAVINAVDTGSFGYYYRRYGYEHYYGPRPHAKRA